MSSKINKSDKKYMNLAISLAEDRTGLTGTNPSVGCVIVNNNQIVSVGQTGIGGVPHAETVAIKNANKTKLKNSSMYVTLEPCNHYGKTPPCTKQIIDSKIKKVFYGIEDIDFRTAGKSKKILNKNNIVVKNNITLKKIKKLYRSYFFLKKKKIPFITGKIVCTKDFYINQTPRYISNKFSLDFSHLLRFKNHGILISYKTANNDNPKLNCRLNGLEKFSPKRIIIDKDLRINKKLYIINSAKPSNTYIFYNKRNSKYNYLKRKGIKLIYCPLTSDNHMDISCILKKIRNLKIDYLLVEGGKTLTSELLKLNLFNIFYLIRSDENSSMKKKNNILNILKLLKKNRYSKSINPRTYVGRDTIIEYIK